MQLNIVFKIRLVVCGIRVMLGVLASILIARRLEDTLDLCNSNYRRYPNKDQVAGEEQSREYQ